MFRDSRGVVHTVSSADPMADLPPDAVEALRGALLRPDDGDIGTALERCDAVQELLEAWQELFFASLPAEVDLAEEQRWAAEAGLSLDEVEAGFEDDDLELADDDDDDDSAGPLATGDDEEETDEDDLRQVLSEELIGLLERELLLLPLRVRLEALVAAETLVITWAELLADHEKLLGHLVIAHGQSQDDLGHEGLARRHAVLHATSGAGHSGAGSVG